MSAKLIPGIRELQTLFEFGRIGDCTDDQLLDQFRRGAGPAAEMAFATLVQRHGPMVLRVCRSTLNDEHDAQDAFQATFLVLVNGAGAVRDRSSIASWLYGVALRVASRARVRVAKRRAHERAAAALSVESRPEAGAGPLPDRCVLHEEIRRLPEKYRSIILLCYFDGLTQEQAAQQLGWPAGTVRGRLFRAREILRSRLSRRGLAVTGGALLAGLLPQDALAVPTALVDATARAAVHRVGGSALVGGGMTHRLASAVRRATGLAPHVGLKSGVTVLGIGLVAVALFAAPASFRPNTPRSTPPPQPPPRTASVSTPQPEPEPQTDETPENVKAPETLSSKPPETPDIDDSPRREPFAVAAPLTGITIDGDLADWPANIERHSLLKVFSSGPYGGLDGLDLQTNPDLCASFSVGYDVKTQLLYLAVVVRDDQVVIGHTSHLDTDAVELYVDGLLGTRKFTNGAPTSEKVTLSGYPVQQYIGIPGAGRIYGTPELTNPVLLGGDLQKTNTRMKFQRKGDVTTYEWAVQVFDRYPDQPTKLAPGKRIGFDVAVVDRDPPATKLTSKKNAVPNLTGWIYWGPTWDGIKVLDAGSLGELVLGEGP
jgi:RNA polymerase sigma factor (sigma-70 family)